MLLREKFVYLNRLEENRAKYPKIFVEIEHQTYHFENVKTLFRVLSDEECDNNFQIKANAELYSPIT